jgi:hypothetical protein
MGRTIAHAIVHELKGIQKAASEDEAKETPAEEKKEHSNPLMAAIEKKKEEAKNGEGEKEKEAYAKIVQERAFDLLKQAGYVDEEGNVTPPGGFDKEAQAVIDRDALQVLEDMGYPVNWSE